MKHLLWLMILAGLCSWFGNALIHDPGYVLILFHGWQIQSTAIVFVCLGLFMLLILFFGVKILTIFLHIPKVIQRLFTKLQHLRQTKHLRQGLEAYYKGDWVDALKGFSHLPHATTPWMVDLMAAQAAQYQGQLKTRDQFLHLAATQEPKARTTILLFQAHLQFDQQQFEQAQATLNHIAQFEPKCPPEWYTLQCKLFLEFKEYSKGLNLLESHRELNKQPLIYVHLYKKMFVGVLTPYFEKMAFEKAHEFIDKLPKHLKTDIELLEFFAPVLLTQKSYAREMEHLIKKALKKETTIQAKLQLIGALPTNPLWLTTIENIELTEHHDAGIYLKLGQIKTKYQLWGAAIQDIQKSIALEKTPEAYALLAKIYLELRQTSHACQAMEQSLLLQT
ncbi:MAG: HemY protein [Pseudomonadota bacterium]|nr:HemY protein [Pseudomonadota bacterium]